ncbi:MAG: hypothetical protein A3G52_03750 [Candidatus Taylorbacteria bacterium RIFCSPLOWO2_12_FULL_43_20]|uniref:DoxX family protein n=1 Tax=Candidatus Taylorbacteria bacterium RIFCSPLOWO2_12_FULL_43_20 TaxID=1802332 RepID=A0A1G2P3T1_9BACT|nr:MAG: hypothetical protein A2825_00700 [Candidatus Taylorbacteria bacterium RIFCSPHIGHO2_01_FULL_43_120]OHA22866.1 MAG: hypothetical protein A3B98_01575 [Candidatus Taylorbacteria bacterium RIFCSPHIGHO2_02_FULL_43_55]OHA29351.1 MAG: hypothetical protein A3E92_02320 [Candidatus Taylorbacteria bacterium RIFCSPHIGHO2_12_FULL_42_34]OHA31728.1 MAG: hypothetical protein A3B09_01765 [Candidatus Taylorbacteria bacterium RIFCSPLOWO2_01_FULL_43_83]OHA38779.1 MAG: hypothetical protein A3H58_01875 [Candi
MGNREKISYFLIRTAIAFAFLYPAVRIHFDPQSWTGYFPLFIKASIPELILVSIYTFVHVAIAVWILTGKKLFVPYATATILLLAVVLFNLNQIDILFRDISLLFVTAGLAVGHLGEISNGREEETHHF